MSQVQLESLETKDAVLVESGSSQEGDMVRWLNDGGSSTLALAVSAAVWLPQVEVDNSEWLLLAYAFVGPEEALLRASSRLKLNSRLIAAIYSSCAPQEIVEVDYWL